MQKDYYDETFGPFYRTQQVILSTTDGYSSIVNYANIETVFHLYGNISSIVTVRRRGQPAHAPTHRIAHEPRGVAAGRHAGRQERQRGHLLRPVLPPARLDRGRARLCHPVRGRLLAEQPGDARARPLRDQRTVPVRRPRQRLQRHRALPRVHRQPGLHRQLRVPPELPAPVPGPGQARDRHRRVCRGDR